MTNRSSYGTPDLRLVVLILLVMLSALGFAQAGQLGSRTAPIGMIDLDAEPARQVVVDREQGQYLGHPTTVLLPDGRTILCV